METRYGLHVLQEQKTILSPVSQRQMMVDLLLVGNTYSSPLDTSYSDIIVMKIDDGGFVYWSKTFGGLRIMTKLNPSSVQVMVAILFLEIPVSYRSVTKSALAMKIDDAGNQVWSNVSDTYSSNYFYAGDRMLMEIT